MNVVVRGPFEEVLLVDCFHASMAERTSAMPTREALCWMRLGGARAMDARTLRELGALVFSRETPTHARERLVSGLEDALATGRLLAVRRARRRAAVPVADPEPVLGPSDEPTSWIELELVDGDGQPVADEAYEIETADGRLRSGTLDWKGRAREECIDPGRCKVRFPRLHEWRVSG